jgi:bifunctional non-homologous end joining protein LigD
MVFDVMRVDGKDVCDQPLGERRRILRGLGLEHSTWQVPEAYDDGAMLFEATLAQGLEGIVSKRLTSRYVPGQRSKSWLKFAHRHRRSYVVGGWRPQEGTADRLASLLVGEPTDQGLVYRGRVGSGIGGAASRSLTALVGPLRRAASPFDDEVPAVDARGTFWVEPVLVVDVETHGVGYTRLRQPSYRGVRSDLSATDLAPAHLQADR